MSLSTENSNESEDSLRSGQAKCAIIHAAKTEGLPDAAVGGNKNNNNSNFDTFIEKLTLWTVRQLHVFTPISQ
jgi:hypothetical protein